MTRFPSLANLKLFLLVARYRSFSRAATEAHLSQPALSRTIRLIEEELGVRLFDRNSRNVVLTAAGEALYPVVDRLTADYEGAFSELIQTFSGARGRVIVGALPSVAARQLPQAIASFHRENPEVEIILHDRISATLAQELRERRIDLAVTTDPRAPDIRFDSKFEDDYVLVCRADSALAEAATARWHDLATRPFVAMASGSSVRAFTDHMLTSLGIVVKPLYECTHLTTAGGLIDSCNAVIALPRSATALLVSPNLTLRPLIPRVSRAIGISRLDARTLPPAAEGLWRHLVEQWEPQS